MKPIHPGRILKREMSARNLSANKLALALRVPSGRITQILLDHEIVNSFIRHEIGEVQGGVLKTGAISREALKGSPNARGRLHESVFRL